MTKKLLVIYAVILAAWLFLPTLVIIPVSFSEVKSFNFPPKGFSLRWYENFFTDPAWLKAFGTSIQVAILTTITATIVGVLAALGLKRLSVRVSRTLESYFTMPMIIPGIVLAIGMYSLFLRMGLVGTLLGFVAAHTVLAFPFVLINVWASLQSFDTRLNDAAASLGANRFIGFVTVTLPLIAPGLLAGALFAFATSFDEVVLSLFIQSPYLQTLPVKIFSSVTQDSDPTVAVIAILMMIISVVLISIVQRFSSVGGRGRR